MGFAQFSNDKLDESKAFYPVDPTGEKLGSIIFLKSMKSRSVLKEIDRIRRKANQSGGGIDEDIRADVSICSAVIDKIEGFTIKTEDNTFGFEVDGEDVISNAKNIKILMENFIFLRKQVAIRSSDDSFFYMS